MKSLIPSEYLSRLSTKKIAKNEIIFHEGDVPSAVYLLKSGLIKTIKYASRDDASIIDFIIPGQMFGMIAVMDNKNYPVSSVALRPSEIVGIPAAEFNDILQKVPEFRKEVFRQVGKHIRHSQILNTLMRESVERRLAHILDYLSESMGREIQLSRESMAAMAGCTESTAVRTLIQFKKNKIIQTGWKKITLLSPEKLKALL